MIIAVLFILVIISLGVATRFGYSKRLFITKGIPGVYPRYSVYALIPIGSAFLSALFFRYVFGPNWSDNGFYMAIFVLLMLLALITLFWQPHWLKPYWLRWLEDYYGHVLEEMFEEARQMGAHEWEAQVSTQADLERWADQVAQKYGWRRLR